LDGSTFYIGRRGLGSLGMYVRINW